MPHGRINRKPSIIRTGNDFFNLILAIGAGIATFYAVCASGDSKAVKNRKQARLSLDYANRALKEAEERIEITLESLRLEKDELEKTIQRIENDNRGMQNRIAGGVDAIAQEITIAKKYL